MATHNNSNAILIGKDISWKAIQEEDLKITHFSPFATVEAGKIRGVRTFMPYYQ